MVKVKHDRNGRNPRPERALARKAYIEAPPCPGEPNTGDVARTHGYSPKAMQAIAADEGWTALRADHRRKLEAARQ